MVNPKKRRPREAAEAGGPRGAGGWQGRLAPTEARICPRWAQTPFCLVRGERGPVQAPPSFPPSTGWGDRGSGQELLC